MALSYDEWIKKEYGVDPNGFIGRIYKGEQSNKDKFDQYTRTEIPKEVQEYVQQVAGALGATLTPEQMEKIQSSFQNAKDLDSVRDLIIAQINTFAAENYRNPTVGDDTIGKVKSIFQSVYGRDASDDEASYFAKELAQGKSTYELAEELKSLPEYQRMQATKDRAELDTSLQTQQSEIFKRATPQIIASFMKAGRLNSSGLNAALAQAQADLDKDRQSSLAQVGAGDNATIRANAFNQFKLSNQPYMQARDIFSRAGSYGTGLNYTSQGLARAREIADYNRQASDYQRYLNQQLDAQNDASNMNLIGNIGGGVLAGLL